MTQIAQQALVIGYGSIGKPHDEVLRALKSHGYTGRMLMEKLQFSKPDVMPEGMLDANDLTGGLVFLLSDHARYITGQNLVIDDGFTL